MLDPLVPLADPHRAMPADAADCLDHARAALASLRDEQRRLSRIGFEAPLSRCQDQLRYWRFVAGLLSLPAAADGEQPRGGSR